MIRLEDRQVIAQAVEEAHVAGARLRPACELAGIDVRTLQRWKAGDGLVRGDRRPEAVRERPAHALSEAERTRLLQVANEPRFADVPPARTVAVPGRRRRLDHRLRRWPRRRMRFGAGT